MAAASSGAPPVLSPYGRREDEDRTGQVVLSVGVAAASSGAPPVLSPYGRREDEDRTGQVVLSVGVAAASSGAPPVLSPYGRREDRTRVGIMSFPDCMGMRLELRLSLPDSIPGLCILASLNAWPWSYVQRKKKG